MIINSLLGGPLRFNELKRQTGNVSQRLLAAQLRGLEEEEVVSRTILNVMPPHVEYALTEKGMDIKGVIDARAAGARKNSRLIQNRRVSANWTLQDWSERLFVDANNSRDTKFTSATEKGNGVIHWHTLKHLNVGLEAAGRRTCP